MTVYAMVHVEVRDDEAYGRYAAIAGPAVAQYGGEFLARGGETITREGRAWPRNVLIRFPDMATAQAFYDGPEYQEALSHALPVSDRNYMFVEGI